MNRIQLIRSQENKNFCELLRNCEMRICASRIGFSVAHFFADIVPQNSKIHKMIETHILENTVEPLLTLGMDDWAKWRLIKAVARVPLRQGRQVVAEALKLLDSDMHTSSRVRMVKALVSVPQEEREGLVACTRVFIHCFMDVEGRIAILKELAEIVPAERGSVVAAGLKLIVPGRIAKIGILSAIARLPRALREPFVLLAKKFLPKKITVDGLIEFFNVTYDLSRQEREPVVAQALRLITPEMSDRDRCSILRIVARIPENERENMVACGRPFFNGKFEVHEMDPVFRFLQDEVPQHERAELVELTLEASIPHTIGPFFMTYLLKGVATIPQEERARVVAQSQRFFEPGMDWMDKLTILGGVSRISPNEIGEIFRELKRRN